ncbi:Uncharacterized protein DAT39_000286 [Clarias magur]|uniref:Uncharacterized protein n=1 Tax=Clarias magur TaxID=1594786 RepID=A0A8J4XHC1_CLAMG|nr:Uncharacterized protein DAT39_000286 [Clarias magur]
MEGEEAESKGGAGMDMRFQSVGVREIGKARRRRDSADVRKENDYTCLVTGGHKGATMSTHYTKTKSGCHMCNGPHPSYRPPTGQARDYKQAVLRGASATTKNMSCDIRVMKHILNLKRSPVHQLLGRRDSKQRHDRGESVKGEPMFS